jgi:hypothetical protein
LHMKAMILNIVAQILPILCQELAM